MERSNAVVKRVTSPHPIAQLPARGIKVSNSSIRSPGVIVGNLVAAGTLIVGKHFDSRQGNGIYRNLIFTAIVIASSVHTTLLPHSLIPAVGGEAGIRASLSIDKI